MAKKRVRRLSRDQRAVLKDQLLKLFRQGNHYTVRQIEIALTTLLQNGLYPSEHLPPCVSNPNHYSAWFSEKSLQTELRKLVEEKKLRRSRDYAGYVYSLPRLTLTQQKKAHREAAAKEQLLAEALAEFQSSMTRYHLPSHSITARAADPRSPSRQIVITLEPEQALEWTRFFQSRVR